MTRSRKLPRRQAPHVAAIVDQLVGLSAERAPAPQRRSQRSSGVLDRLERFDVSGRLFALAMLRSVTRRRASARPRRGLLDRVESELDIFDTLLRRACLAISD